MFHQSKSRSPRGWAAATVLVLTWALAGTAWSDPPAPKSLPVPDSVAQAGKGKRSDTVVKVTATGEKPDAQGKQLVTVTLQMDKDWHTYANPPGTEFGVATTVQVTGKPGTRLLQVNYPPGRLAKEDSEEYRVYEDQAVIKAVVQRAAGDNGPIELDVKIQACSFKEKTCLPPATVKLMVP